jgi:3-oxoadipate enol-lactonase
VIELNLAHDVSGTGPVLVLLHSTVCDRRMWEPQVSAFADAGYQVVRCDFRGFGDTPAPGSPHNDADDVIALLDGLGLAAVTIVGSSYGGKVALEVAARQPERVRALALLCAGMPGHEPTAALRGFWAGEAACFERGDIDGAVELNVENWLGPDADPAARELVGRMQRRAFDIQLAAPEEIEPIGIAVDLSDIGDTPVLAAWGGKDLPDFRQIAEHLAAALPNTRALELPWAGHLPSLERPGETTAIVLEFLNLVHGGSASAVRS